jgi:hypothetical protein
MGKVLLMICAGLLIVSSSVIKVVLLIALIQSIVDDI